MSSSADHSMDASSCSSLDVQNSLSEGLVTGRKRRITHGNSADYQVKRRPLQIPADSVDEDLLVIDDNIHSAEDSYDTCSMCSTCSTIL